VPHPLGFPLFDEFCQSLQLFSALLPMLGALEVRLATGTEHE
jgi:hypothetical protein